MKALAVIGTVLALAAGGWLAYAKYFAPSPADPFITQPLDRGDIVQSVSATGTIEPLVKVIVGSQVSGQIRKWHTDFNAPVKTGDVLAEIDPARFETAADQASANLVLAKARADELLARFKDAQRERARLESLRGLDTASENEYLIAQTAEEAARAAWQGAEAGIRFAEAALNEARVDLDRSIIRSPIDGVVISRNIEDGQTVAASLQAPELFVIANDLQRMQVNANVSESDIGLIHEGGLARFRVDAYPMRTFDGTISQIRYNASNLDGVVTYVTLIEVANPDLALRPGMTANVTFEVARAENVVRIPNAALRFSPAESEDTPRRRSAGPRTPTIYVLENGQPAPRSVEVGLSDGSMTELKSGKLQEGDVVIVDRNWRAGGDRRRDASRVLRRA